MRLYFDSTDSTSDLEAVVDLVLSVLNERDDVKKGTLPDPLKSAGEAPTDFIQPPIPTGQPEPVEIPTDDAPAPPAEVVTEAPPPPPPVEVPSAALTPAPSKTRSIKPAAGDPDSSGCPWDKRIHATTKTQTDAGKWKRRRGVDDDIFRAVMHEITDPKFDPNAVPTAGVDPSVPPAPTVPDPSTAGLGETQSQGSGIEITDLVQRVMTAKLVGSLTQEQVDRAVSELGIEGGFNALVAHPELFDQLVVKLGL